jgi:hypothetical protein
VDAEADAEFMGCRHDLGEEAGVGGAQRGAVDALVAGQGRAQARDVVTIVGAGQADFDPSMSAQPTSLTLC